MPVSCRVTDSALAQLCHNPQSSLNPVRAGRISRALGPLARWWLAEDVLRLAADAPGTAEATRNWLLTPARPRVEPGGCFIVFARSAEHPCLAASFLLPLRWVEGADHSLLLPPDLRALARQVISAVLPRAQWGLCLSTLDGLDGVDLTGLTLKCGSGWTSLAAGLIAADEQAECDPEIWATGEWTPGVGVTAVEGIRSKLDLAAACGAKAVFLPSAQAQEATEWADNQIGRSRPEIRLFKPLERNIRAVLGEYLAASEVPPSDEAPLSTHSAYYVKTFSRHPPAARKHYRKRAMMRAIEAQLRADFKAVCQAPPEVLISVVSGQIEGGAVVANAVQAERYVLLYTADMTQSMHDMRGLLDEREPELHEFSDDQAMEEQVQPLLERMLDALDASTVYLDVTPGTKLMSLMLEAQAARLKAGLLYLRALKAPGSNTYDPQTSRLIVWYPGNGESWQAGMARLTPLFGHSRSF